MTHPSRTTLLVALAALAFGFVAGAFWMDARRAPEIAALEAALGQQMIADLAALGGALPGPSTAAGCVEPAAPVAKP